MSETRRPLASTASSLLLSAALCLVFAPSASVAQSTDLVWQVPQTGEPQDPYSDAFVGGQFSGAHSVTGPFDLDGDGKIEVLATDFSGGGRVHVIETQGPNTWELVYSTPFRDTVETTNNARYATGGDLDGDGKGEIIFVSGNGFRGEVATQFPAGIYVYEFTGADDDYGDLPAGVYTLAAVHDGITRVKSDNFSVVDVDGDGTQELLFPNDASSPYDEWYILSVSGDLDGSGFEVWNEELRLSTRNDEWDPVDRGGGSTYAINAADLDGESGYELSMHTWNFFNFTNADVTGPDQYEAPAADAENVFIQLRADVGNDDLSWFNGVVVDINGDGDDEVFYPREYGYDDGLDVYEHITVLNYEDGEDPLQITEEQIRLDLFGPLTAYGITAGDIDGDGQPELIGAGRGYDASDYQAGRSPRYLRVAEWLGGVGGDPEEASNYRITPVEFAISPADTLFNRVERDSAGVLTTYYENAGQIGAFPPGSAEEISPTKIAYLGDADGDGAVEVGAGFYGINDTLYVYDDVWDPDVNRYRRSVREKIAVETRPVMRIFEIGSAFVANEERIVLPSDYVLEGNYPNPFNPSTTIAFTLPVDKTVSLRIYDANGRLVRTLLDGRHLPQGRHEVQWNGAAESGGPLASGTYFYALEYGSFKQVRSMVLLK